MIDTRIQPEKLSVKDEHQCEHKGRILSIIQRWQLEMSAEIQRIEAGVWDASAEGIATAVGSLEDMLSEYGYKLWEI